MRGEKYALLVGVRRYDPNELRSVYGQKDYADVQKQLEGELKRLRTELKVPDPDPPATFLGAKGPQKAKSD